jgi:glycosyltransferase involved in cell wall biosynthesis
VLERWHREYPHLTHKIVHIANGFDPEEISVAAPIPRRQRRVMAHVGAIYTGRHPVPLLHSLERLIANGRVDPDRFLLHLIGDIAWDFVPEREMFRRLAARGCLEAPGTVMPGPEARQKMREADYLLLLDILMADAGQQLPSKVFEYIPIGRPILALTTRNSPTDRVLAGSGIPSAFLYADSTPEQADEAVSRILAAPSDPPVRPSEWFFETFDAERRTRALVELIDPNTSRTPAGQTKT